MVNVSGETIPWIERVGVLTFNNKPQSRYRYQLEAFVDKIRGRTPPYWHEPVKSITGMETIERVYVQVLSKYLLLMICVLIYCIGGHEHETCIILQATRGNLPMNASLALVEYSCRTPCYPLSSVNDHKGMFHIRAPIEYSNALH